MGYDVPPPEGGGMLGRSLSRRDSRGLNSDVQLTRSDSLHRQVKEKPRGVAIHGNDLLVCFAPRTSLSLVARPSLSPARGGGGGGGGGRGPSAFSNSTGKKLCAPIEEPSSPKVTCIGQVRNRHSHSNSKNRRNSANNSSPKRWFGGGGSKKEGGSSACSRFGKDFSCFGNCDSPAKMPSCGREGKTCGAFFAKSLLLLQQTDTSGKEKQGAVAIAAAASDSSPQGVIGGDASNADRIPEKEPAMATMEEEEEEESNRLDCIHNPSLTSTPTPTSNPKPSIISPSTSNSAPSPSFTSSPNPSNSVPNPSLRSSPNPSFTSSPNPSFNSAPNPIPNLSFTSSPNTVPNPSLISTPHPSFTSPLNPSFTSSPNPSFTSPNPSPNPNPSITSAPSPNSNPKFNPNQNPSFVDKEDEEDDGIIQPPPNALLIMRQRASLLKRSRSAPSKTISMEAEAEAEAEAEEEPETIAGTEKTLMVSSKKTMTTTTTTKKKKKKQLIQTPYLKRSVSDSSNLHRNEGISGRNSTSTKEGIAIDTFSSSSLAEMELQQEPSPVILESEASMMEPSSGLCLREEDQTSSTTEVIMDESNSRDNTDRCNEEEEEGEEEGRSSYASSSSSLTSPENNTLPEEVLAEHSSPIIPHEALLILEYRLMDGLKVSVDSTEAYLLKEEEEKKSALRHALSPILQCQKLVNRKDRGDDDDDDEKKKIKQGFYEWKSRKSAEWPLQSAFQLPRCKSAPVRPASYV